MGKDGSSSSASAAVRARADFRPTWQRFVSSSHAPSGPSGGPPPYNRQYSHVYSLRLSQLRGRCLDAASSSTSAHLATPKKLSEPTEDGDAPNDPVVVPRILELREGVLSIVVGTVVKDMPLRPSVDTGYKSTSGMDGRRTTWAAHSYGADDDEEEEGDDDAGGITGLDPIRTYCSATPGSGGEDGDGGERRGDVLMLEDESGRVELVPSSSFAAGDHKLNIAELATGCVLAVTGVVRAGTGDMEVRSAHLPAPPPPPKCIARQGGEKDEREKKRTGGAKVLLVSGLGCGSPSAEAALKRDMLLDYVSGHCFDAAGSVSTADKICRIVVAGGGTVRPDLHAVHSITPQDVKSQSGTFDPSLPLKELDLYLSEFLSSGLQVDYLPGKYDPTNVHWPQRPIHPCLLPVSGGYSEGMRRCTNPYSAAVGGRDVVGTDGLNVEDLGRYVAKTVSKKTTKEEEDDDDMEMELEIEEKKEEEDTKPPSPEEEELVPLSPIELLELTLRYSHLAPTGPDSLPTFPSGEIDPFVLDSLPDLYFAGNCLEFDTKLVQIGEGRGDEEKEAKGRTEVRVVCVPSFERTGIAVSIDLDTMEAEEIRFDLVDDEADIKMEQ